MISNIPQQQPQHSNYDKRIIVTEKVITEKLPTLTASSHNINYNKNFNNMIESTITSSSVRPQSKLVFINSFQPFNSKLNENQSDNSLNGKIMETSVDTKFNKDDYEKQQNKNNLSFIDSTKIHLNNKNFDIVDSSNLIIIKNSDIENNLNQNCNTKAEQLEKIKNLTPLDLLKSPSHEISAFTKTLSSSTSTMLSVSSPTLSTDSNFSISSPTISKSSIMFPNLSTVPIKLASSTIIPEKDATVICNGWKTLKSNSTNNIDAKNSHSYQRSFIEDVHNYSKKSPTNSYEALSTPPSSSSCSSVNGSIDGDVDDDEFNDNGFNDNGDGFYESDNNDNQIKNIEINTNFNLRFNRTKNVPQNTEAPPKGIKISKRNLKNSEADRQNNNVTAPMHHARRPMNAFLIFCKRHRGIVKTKFFNVENRQITKILGDWWENLSAEDKSCYSNLAKDYKDAFLSANPNFQWYKLPAPPLRTLTNVAAASVKAASLSPTIMPASEIKIENECEDADVHIEDENLQEMQGDNIVDKQVMGVFKFADEAQMGGLSSLISAISEQQKPSSPTNLKRKSNELNEIPNKKFHRDSSFSSSGEDDLKPTRSCKGKKYQELINSGQIGLVCNKKIVKKSNLSNGEQQLKQNGHFSSDSEHNFMENGIRDNIVEKKPFDSNDFDLESKIMSLPAQDLEQYLARKDDEKCKKQIKIKRRIGKKYKYTREKKKKTEAKSIAKTEENDQQQLQQLKQQQIQQQINAVTGSQKRKARKESITRRDITAIQQENQNQILQIVNDDGEIEVMEIKLEPTEICNSSIENNVNNINTNGDNNNDKWNLSSTSDLSILAEVASKVIE